MVPDQGGWIREKSELTLWGEAGTGGDGRRRGGKEWRVRASLEVAVERGCQTGRRVEALRGPRQGMLEFHDGVGGTPVEGTERHTDAVSDWMSGAGVEEVHVEGGAGLRGTGLRRWRVQTGRGSIGRLSGTGVSGERENWGSGGTRAPHDSPPDWGH